MSYCLEVVADGYEAKLQAPRRVSVGDLDGLFNGGLPVRTLTLLFGSAGVGKSTLALQLAAAANQSGFRTLYATAVDTEVTREDLMLMANRISVPLSGMAIAEVESVEDVLGAADEFRAEFVVIDSFHAAAGYEAPRMRVSIRKVRRWCRSHGAAAFGIGMRTTAGFAAGGYAVAFGADSLADLDRVELAGNDTDDASLRLLRLHKYRGGSEGEMLLRMTSGGLAPWAPMDPELHQLVGEQPAVGAPFPPPPNPER